MLAMPRVIAWRIHHVAYVENLKPLRQSNFSTACIRPRLPSWMRSSSGSPDAWYFLAIDTTRRRFDCTNWRSASSPWRAVRRSSRLRVGGDLLAAGVEGLDRLLARFDRLGETDLVVLGQQRVLPDVGEVETNEVFVIAINAIFGHGGSFVPSRRGPVSSGRGTRSQAGNVLTIPTRSSPPTRQRACSHARRHRGSRCAPRRRARSSRLRCGGEQRENRRGSTRPADRFRCTARRRAAAKGATRAQPDPQRQEVRGGASRLGRADAAEPRRRGVGAARRTPTHHARSTTAR